MTTITCRHVLATAATAMSLFMGGCATPSAPPPVSPSSPGLTSAVKPHPVQTDYEKRLSACVNDGSCDRLHFLIGLSALKNHPEVAAAHFREAMKSAPKSSTSNLSRLWLNVLGEASRQEDQQVAGDTTEWLLLELLNRDKQVEELSKQLNALKSVDLDMKERTARMKPRIAPLPKLENGQ